jgi:hypothetical protein
MMPNPFFPIHIEVGALMPDMSILQGGLRYPKFTLNANSLPVAIEDGHGLMVRLTSRIGFEGAFTCYHLDVHDQDGLLTVRVKGNLQGSGNIHVVELLHLESRHDATGSVAQVVQVALARRVTSKGKRRSAAAAFTLELFRPRTV